MGADHSGRIVDPSLSFVDPRLAKLAALWTARAAGGHIPDRSAFGPETLHALGLLPNVMLVDVVDGGARFRYRLIGTEITTTVERDATGKFFDELYKPRTLKNRTESMRWVLRERRPLRTADHLDLQGKEYIGYEALVAPLANGDEIVLILIAVVRAMPARDEA
jgi:hypothetical protein